MKKSEMELQSYKKAREELENEIFFLSLMEEGAVFNDKGDIFTESRELYNKILEKYQAKPLSFWKGQKDWSVGSMFLERYKNQQDMVKNYFMPYLDKSQRVGDLASANGEWSLRLSEYAGQIDGFEYSEDMVTTAKQKAKKLGIKNVSFEQADACSLKLEYLYDNFMMMGLLTCIIEDADAKRIVNNVASALKSGARLIVKDTLNIVGEDVIYIYSMQSGYQGIYRSKEKYCGFFEEAGLVLEHEEVLNEVNESGITFVSWGGYLKR